MCQGSIDIHGLASNSLLLFDRHCGDGPHVVQSISQLDNEDAQILGHRHEHLAHSRCLLLFFGVKLQTLKFGDAIHDCGNVTSELFLNVRNSQFSVFNSVV